MKLGVFTVLYSGKTLESALDLVQKAGLQTVEIGTGGYVGKAHISPSEILRDASKIADLKRMVEERGLSISALSCHGNPLHPNQAIAAEHHEDFLEHEDSLMSKDEGFKKAADFLKGIIIGEQAGEMWWA